MALTLSIVALVFAPAAILFFYFWVRDRWEREPWSILVSLLGLGCIGVLPAAVIESVMVGFKFEVTTLWHAAAMGFLVAGLVEESIKFMIAYWFTKRSSYFSEEYDGIIYTVAVGLGFAFAENILYIGAALFSEGAPLATAIARAFTAVPSHALDGAVMGYFIGRAHFAEGPAERMKLNFLGLLFAILFHGLYDFFAFSTFVLPERVAGWSIAGLIWTLCVQWGTVHRLIVTAQLKSLARARISAK